MRFLSGEGGWWDGEEPKGDSVEELTHEPAIKATGDGVCSRRKSFSFGPRGRRKAPRSLYRDEEVGGVFKTVVEVIEIAIGGE
jgi:hypothetical protein